MIELLTSPWRPTLRELLASVHDDLLIASPFIKTSEAQWACGVVQAHAPARLRLTILTDVRSESVLSGALDLNALQTFAKSMPETQIVTLPQLHAKVYVADDAAAIVTSGNLTSAGLDSNYEYGIALRDPSVVSQIRRDLEAYARIGNRLALEVLESLTAIGEELAAEYQELQRSTKAGLRQRFTHKLREAKHQFLRAQVGSRSANSVFSEAIVYVLSHGPLTTRELHPRIQRLLPDLCDDTAELIINGERFGKRWKHAVRNAQQFLKGGGLVTFDGRRWSLTGSTWPE